MKRQKLNELFVSIRAGIRVCSVLAHDEVDLIPHVLVVDGLGAFKVHPIPGNVRLLIPKIGGRGITNFDRPDVQS